MTSVLKLYEWGNELDRVKEMLYEAEGELTPEIESALEDVTLGFEEKAERVALYIRELQSSAKAVEGETDRLAARAKAFKKSADNLKAYLLAQMQRAEIPKIEGKFVTVRIQKSNPAVKTLVSQEVLASWRGDLGKCLYVVTQPESYRVDAAYAIALWKAGKELPEGIAVEQSTHIRIA